MVRLSDAMKKSDMLKITKRKKESVRIGEAEKAAADKEAPPEPEEVVTEPEEVAAESEEVALEQEEVAAESEEVALEQEEVAIEPEEGPTEYDEDRARRVRDAIEREWDAIGEKKSSAGHKEVTAAPEVTADPEVTTEQGQARSRRVRDAIEREIAAIRHEKVTTVTTDTETESAPTSISVEAEDIYGGLIGYMEEVGKSVRKGERFNIEEGTELIGVAVNNPNILDELHQLTNFCSKLTKDFLPAHSANVAINAMLMARGFGYPKQQQVELGVAALFHDIGMFKVPDDVARKGGELTPSEMKVIKGHPELSYKELLKYGDKYRWLAEVVYQEHERLDGSGYPRGLKGEDIHEYASIIGVLDLYDTLIHGRPQRDGLLPAHAVREILEGSKKLFPAAVIKNLLSHLSHYPVRSFVKLNDNSIGMVVRTNPLWSLKPTVRLIYDAKGEKTSEETTVDLAKSSFLYIKDAISEEEIPDLGQ